MLVFFSILAIILLLIIILLLLPVHIFLKKDNDSEFEFNVKALFFDLSKMSDDENASLNIKSIFGLDKKSNESPEKGKKSFADRITYYSALISDIFSAATSAFRKITVRKLQLNIVCAEEDAADTAISYGACCAVVLPIISTIDSLTTVNKDNEKVNISCDYTSEKGHFDFDIHFSIRIYALLSAVIRFGLNRAKRKPLAPQKSNTQKK